jgi:hypothetical protein
MPLLFDQYVRKLQGQLSKPMPKQFMEARPHSPQAFQEQQRAKAMARGDPRVQAAQKGRRGEGVAPRTSQPQGQKGNSPFGKPQSRIQALLKTGRAQRQGRGAATTGGLSSAAAPLTTFHKSLTMARPGQDPRRSAFGGRRYGGARSKGLR